MSRPPAEAQRCTCPSGDGSLRWPCPAHPPEAQPVGVEGLVRKVCERLDKVADYAHTIDDETVVVALSNLPAVLDRALSEALSQQPAAVDEVHELRLCESSRLHLFPDRLYRFTVDPDCSMCAEALSHCALAAQPGGEA